MSEQFGNDIISISDDDGNEYSLEHFDTIEIDDTFYIACVPADTDEDDEDFGLYIFEAQDDGYLASVDDEELLEELYDMFMERLFGDMDDEEPEQ